MDNLIDVATRAEQKQLIYGFVPGFPKFHCIAMHTCHCVSKSLDLVAVLLGVQFFPLTHSAVHIAEVTSNLIAEWGITEEVFEMVTDWAHNIVN